MHVALITRRERIVAYTARLRGGVWQAHSAARHRLEGLIGMTRIAGTVPRRRAIEIALAIGTARSMLARRDREPPRST